MARINDVKVKPESTELQCLQRFPPRWATLARVQILIWPAGLAGSAVELELNQALCSARLINLSCLWGEIQPYSLEFQKNRS